jgi:Protein of unknown function (DUF3108)
MTHTLRNGSRAALRALVIAAALVLCTINAEERTIASPAPSLQPFQPGEKLTYDVSWSNVVSAGTAVMEVEEETLKNGKAALKFIVTGRSTGMIDKVFPVNDTVESVFDPSIMESLSYSLKQSHGRRKVSRGLVFDHSRKRVVSTMNDDAPENMDIPDPVQDALSSLYYLRTIEDFAEGKVITVNVFVNGKNWSIEVYTLGREKVKTPAGEFAAIKIKTHPKYEGVFLNKGEVFIWLTDDNRKVPVLMKSTITVGSFVFTLTDMKPGEGAHPVP